MSISRAMRRQMDRKAAKQGTTAAWSYARAKEQQVALTHTDATVDHFAAALTLCCLVLHRDFNWAAIPQGEQNPSDYYRMARFARAVTAEMVRLGDLTSREIREYMERAKEETGIAFEYT